jgi:hypothetical protein
MINGTVTALVAEKQEREQATTHIPQVHDGMRQARLALYTIGISLRRRHHQKALATYVPLEAKNQTFYIKLCFPLMH